MIGRLQRVSRRADRRDGDEIVRLNEAAREDRKTLLEQELVGAETVELRVIVPNEPGVLAKLTLELGKAGVNIVDLALVPGGRPPQRCDQPLAGRRRGRQDAPRR